MHSLPSINAVGDGILGSKEGVMKCMCSARSSMRIWDLRLQEINIFFLDGAVGLWYKLDSH